MTVILDVSAAIEILLQKEKKKLFLEKYQSATWVITPDLYVAEITNVMWKYCKAGIICHDDCIHYVEDGIAMIDDFIDAKSLWKEALGESIKNEHSVYDMLYAVLARRNDAVLLTNDKLLSGVCKKLNIDVLCS
jgi:predicted nucleic acid-binding protein